MPIFLEIFRHEMLILRRNSARLLSGFVFFVIFETVFFLLLQGNFDQNLVMSANSEAVMIDAKFDVQNSNEKKVNKINDLGKDAKFLANKKTTTEPEFSLIDATQTKAKSEQEANLIKQAFTKNDSLGFFASGTIFATLASLLIYFGEFLRRDQEDGTIEQLGLVCQNFEIVILAKLLANWLCSCFAIVICGGIFSFFESESLAIAFKFSLIIALMSLALSAIFAFCGSISSFCNSLSLVGIIALPLTIPTILIANLAISDNFSNNFPILFALMLLNIISAIFAVAKLVRM